MRLTILILLTIPLFLVGCQKKETQISQVKVWDKNSQVIQTLDNSASLEEFKKVWMERTSVSLPERPEFSHKVDITTPEGSTRWLYHPDGYTTVLNIKASNPIYRIAQPNRLREMLIPQQSSPSDDLRNK